MGMVNYESLIEIMVQHFTSFLPWLAILPLTYFFLSFFDDTLGSIFLNLELLPFI